MEEKLNLILKVLALRLRLEYGFTPPGVEELVKEIDEEVMTEKVTKAAEQKEANMSIPSEKSRTLKNFITKQIRKGD